MDTYKDMGADLCAQIERIRAGQIIPDPENEAETQDKDVALPIRWSNGGIEKVNAEYLCVCYAPLNDAMSPDLPKGQHGVFRERGGGDPAPQDGDMVLAGLSVRNFAGFDDEFLELGQVIRRYSHLPDGRVRLTPLREGYASWTDGDLTRYGLIEISVCGVAVPHDGILVNPRGGFAFLSPTMPPRHR
jgi:hypothetical protein